MILTTASDPRGVPASAEAFQAAIPALAGQVDPYAILLARADDRVFMQTLWTPDGFVLEYQEGSLGRHVCAVDENLSAEDVIGALQSYAAGESGWKTVFTYRRVNVGTRWYHAGYAIGRAWGEFRAGLSEARSDARRRG